METEREVIAQAIARLPDALSWEIKRTPLPGQPIEPALKMIAACNLYIILMGKDITAPVGVEWDFAQRVHCPTLAYLKDVPRTPAARVFLSLARANWVRFETPTDLESQIQIALTEYILDHAVSLKLDPAAWESLNALLKELREAQIESESEKETAGEPELGGAGGGGVILAPGGDIPPGGRLLDARRSTSGE